MTAAQIETARQQLKSDSVHCALTVHQTLQFLGLLQELPDYGDYLKWVYERYAAGDAQSTSAADYH